MAFDALFPDQAEQALAERVRRPELNAPRGSGNAFAGMFEALAAAPAAAVLESTRAISPLLDAYGKTMAYRAGARREETIDRIGDNDLGPLLRDEIASIAPDPHTAGTAAQVVYGVGKLIGKATGYGLIGGPAGAVVGTGLDEGINEGMRLQDKGVDAATATKAGAVHGALTAASIALPVAGKTLAQTAGLAGAGGPASFIAENAAISSILEQSGFDQVAKEYDPFDPVGLTVSTVASLVFGAGAHVLRKGKKVEPSARDMLPGEPAPVPLTSETLRGSERMISESEAAARTLLTARNVDAVSLAPRDDFAARSAHADALESSARSLDAGLPVNLALGDMPLDAGKATAAATRLKDAAEAIEARAVEHADWANDIPLETGKGRSVNQMQADTEQATRILTGQPDMPVFTGAVDEQGNPVASRALDLWDDALADLEDARMGEKAFQAAISCFLRHPA